MTAPKSPAEWQRLFERVDALLELPPEQLHQELQCLHDRGDPLADALRDAMDDRGLLQRPLPAPAAGRLCGPYRLLRSLGHGGMGEVWLAERADGMLQRPVALKLPLAPGPGSVLAQRFARERAILATLAHPHIARLYDAGLTAEGQPFLALEYVEGRPLTAACDARRLSVNERVRLFVAVLHAVQHAHGRLIVHRDLKPNNILLDVDGQVKLLDFGIAKLLADGVAEVTELTRMGGHAVTPAYASPEQIAGEPIGVASDVFSAGVVLYELLAGRRPWRPTRDTAAAIEEAILAGDPPPASVAADETSGRTRGLALPALRRQLAGDLDTIVLKALKRQPAERYPSASAFADDLQRWLTGLPVLARPDTLAYRASKFVRRRRVESTIAAAAGVALIGGAYAQLTVAAALAAGSGLALWQARAARRQAALAREHADRAQRESRHAQVALDFVLDLLHSNSSTQDDPARARSATAEQLLRAGAQRVNERLREAPEVQERVLDTLAAMHFEIGLTDEAARLRRQRIELLRCIGGQDDTRLANALLTYAVDVADTRDRVSTGSALSEVERILDANRDTESITRGRLWVELARFHFYHRPARCLLYAERAIEHFHRHPETEGFLRDALRFACKSRLSLGDLDGAERWNEATLQEVQRLHPGATIWMVAPLVEQGELRQARLDLTGAEATLREALAIAERVNGPAHVDALYTGNRLAVLLHASGRRDEARALLDRSLQLLSAGAGASAAPAAVRGTLAVLLLAEGRVDEVEAHLQADLDDLRANYPGALILGKRIVSLAELRLLQERWDEAGTLLCEAEAIWADVFPGDADASCFNPLNLARGRLALARDDHDAATLHFGRVRAPAALTGRDDVPDLEQARAGLAAAARAVLP